MRGVKVIVFGVFLSFSIIGTAIVREKKAAGPTTGAIANVKIENSTNSGAGAEVPFSITSPLGGEHWAMGSTHTITWVGGLGYIIRITYPGWGTLSGRIDNTGSYIWTIPPHVPPQALYLDFCGDYRELIRPGFIWVWKSVYLGRTAVFYIVSPIDLASPNGGERWAPGSSHDITWTMKATVADVKIEYSKNAGASYIPIVASVPNTGSYPWTIPNTPSATCLVRVSDAAVAAANDVSDAVFSIITLPKGTVVSPNGGESWGVGTSHDIIWALWGVNNVKIEYSTNSGASYETIIASTPDTGSCPWTIPNKSSATCLVRVSEASNSSINDASDGMFAITKYAFPRKVDFNEDGEEDILWRREESGQNMAWFMGNVGGAAAPSPAMPISATIADQGAITPSGNKASKRIYWDPRDVGSILNKDQVATVNDPREAGGDGLQRIVNSTIFVDPRIPELRNHEKTSPPFLSNPLELQLRPGVTHELAALGIGLIGSAELPAVADANWRIAGTGDFSGDGKVDILWRHAVTGQDVVWLMKGTNVIDCRELPVVADMKWQIVGTGDFNCDNKVDVLWRQAVTGLNAIWLMSDLTVIDSAELPAVADGNWQIVGTGDFNGNGTVDILWRATPSGQNLVWYMDETNVVGIAEFSAVGDPKWQIVGTGDYNGDGKIDVLWRHAETGQNVVWYMDNTKIVGSTNFPAVADLNWKIVSR